MLGPLFNSVTASLGKTFVYAGLFPAGWFVFLTLLYASAIDRATASRMLVDETAWHAMALAGGGFLLIGFVFYAGRSVVFGMFRRLPTRGAGRWFVFRRAARRTSAQRAQERLQWRRTALLWLTTLQLDLDQVSGHVPHWLVRLDVDLALWLAGIGRRQLVDLDRTAGDVLNLSPRASDRIAAGIEALYFAAGRRHEPPSAALRAEIEAWRSAAGSPQAGEILDAVGHDLQRQFTRAFMERRRFGDGAYTYPTSLGGLISALDDYAEARYGCDTETLWSRIWWVLPKEARAETADAKLAVEALLNMGVASVASALAAVGAELAFRLGFLQDLPADRLVTLAIVLVLSFAVARLCYAGATIAMETLSEKMASLIDAYRLDMLSQLGFAPATIGEELALYRELKGFFVQGGRLAPDRKLRTGRKAGDGVAEAEAAK